MNVSIYLIAAGLAAALLGALAAGMWNLHVSRAVESILDSIEYSLALKRHRRAEMQLSPTPSVAGTSATASVGNRVVSLARISAASLLARRSDRYAA